MSQIPRRLASTMPSFHVTIFNLKPRSLSQQPTEAATATAAHHFFTSTSKVPPAPKGAGSARHHRAAGGARGRSGAAHELAEGVLGPFGGLPPREPAAAWPRSPRFTIVGLLGAGRNEKTCFLGLPCKNITHFRQKLGHGG